MNQLVLQPAILLINTESVGRCRQTPRECIVCLDSAARGMTCNRSPRSDNEAHFICDVCFNRLAKFTCEESGRTLSHPDAVVRCPILGCRSAPWTAPQVLSILDEDNAKYCMDQPSSPKHFSEAASPKEDLINTVARLVIEGMNITCPSCEKVLDPTPDGCCAVCCPYCKMHFCWICHSLFASAACCHTHVTRCLVIPSCDRGCVFVPANVREAAERAHRLVRAREVLSAHFVHPRLEPGPEKGVGGTSAAAGGDGDDLDGSFAAHQARIDLLDPDGPTLKQLRNCPQLAELFRPLPASCCTSPVPMSPVGEPAAVGSLSADLGSMRGGCGLRSPPRQRRALTPTPSRPHQRALVPVLQRHNISLSDIKYENLLDSATASLGVACTGSKAQLYIGRGVRRPALTALWSVGCTVAGALQDAAYFVHQLISALLLLAVGIVVIGTYIYMATQAAGMIIMLVRSAGPQRHCRCLNEGPGTG